MSEYFLTQILGKFLVLFFKTYQCFLILLAKNSDF